MSLRRGLVVLVVLILASVSRGEATKSPCSSVYDLLKSVPALPKETACVQFVPGEHPKIHLMFGRLDPVYGHYLNMAQRFLNDVARDRGSGRTVPLHGEAVIVINDDSTLPLEVLKDMLTRKVPLLAHSILGTDKAEHAVLIPDYHFIEHDGFSKLQKFFDIQVTKLKDRSPLVFWRGSTTSTPCMFHDLTPSVEASINHPCQCSDLQRVRLALQSREIPWLDVGIVKPVQSCMGPEDQGFLRKSNVLKESVNEEMWSKNRGIIEIDGNVNAWGNRWRMVTGSLVFRIESNFTNAYLVCQRPWVHYIPLQSNLSDLVKSTALIRSNSSRVVSKLQTIADNAKKLGSFFTYGEEVRRVHNAIRNIWHKKLPGTSSSHCRHLAGRQALPGTKLQ